MAEFGYADLRNTNFTGSVLFNSNFYYADLEKATLNMANLHGANLQETNFRYANLSETDLGETDLYKANLEETILYKANLDGAALNEAVLTGAKNVPFVPLTCPEVGSFVGFKKAGRYIVELEIPSDARRCSATGRICRCDKAEVLRIVGGNSRLLVSEMKAHPC